MSDKDGNTQKTWSFIEALLKYYKEFLETDFRSRYKPKRKIILAQNEGLVGIEMARYSDLNEIVLDLLTKKFDIPRLRDIDEGEFAIYPDQKAVDNIDNLILKHGKLNEEQLLEEILDDFEDYLKTSKYLDENNLLYSRAELRSLLKEVPSQKYAAIIRKYKLFDFYRDITVVLQTKKLTDKTDFYFYFYEIKFDGESYPIFYIPVSIEHPSLLVGAKPHYTLNFEGSPILYINEKVLQYISERLSESERNKIKIDLPKRQIYWNEAEDFVETLNEILTKVCNRFGLAHFDLKDRNVKTEKENVKVTSNCYVTVFDKSDEAIINDYEELILLLEQENPKALEIFSKLIQEFLLNNPKVVTLEVDDEFDGLSTSEKLTYKSPISLNSEQLKILQALKKDEVRSVIVEGPPGTGKSHTIAAIIYDALLNSKSVLVTSDKKEALDVVEEKITDVLEKIKVDEDGFVQNPILRLGQAETNFNKIFQTQNFEKIKERFGAYKFNHDKTQSEITDRVQQIQDDINHEVEYNQLFHDEILEAVQQTIKFENTNIENWRRLVDIEELKLDDNFEKLDALYKVIQAFTEKDINLKIASASWLQEHLNEESKARTELILDNLETIDDLLEKNNNKTSLEGIIKIIFKHNGENWENFKVVGEKLAAITAYLNENDKDLWIESINEYLYLEKVSALKQNFEDFLDISNKIQIIHDKYKSAFGSRLITDLNVKNSVTLAEYIAEAKKLKSFLWTFRKKSEIESLNKKLELAFPTAKIDKPHSIIPRLESEHLLYLQTVKLREEFNNESTVFSSSLDDKFLNENLYSEKFAQIKDKLNSFICLLDEMENVIEQSRILDLCKLVSTSKNRLTTYEQIKDVITAYEIIKQVGQIEDEIRKLDLPVYGWEELIDCKPLDFIDENKAEKFEDKFEDLEEALEYLSDKSDELAQLRLIQGAIPNTLKKLSIDIEDIDSYENSKISNIDDGDLEELLKYFKNLAKINRFYAEHQISNYNIDRALLQNRYVANMTYILDKKVVEFRTEHSADAQAIRQIIRSKAQIPKKYLRILVEAFPCLIVNIRELGEYLPLEPELFDVVIIDEASQVSIAQAFPALLRAKKIVVLGDTKQFSNVKTSTASIPVNNEAFSVVKETYSKDIKELDNETKDAIKDKIRRFNIKVSILEFMQALANYQAMLLKHFRCYKEVIEYSNKNFYGGRLQVMKLRGKNIKDVIRFELVEDSKEPIQESGASAKVIENANGNEAKFVLAELERLAEKGCKDSVGIITPFRNQQKYISDMIRQSPKYGYLDEKMKLKIMTFDTCQGEERDIVYYSMVESPSNNAKLSTIFAKAMSGDDEEGKLREQRLNVGLSRAKESVVFVLSKQPEDFKGEIGTALRVFKNELEDSLKLPDPSETESEGEKLLLSLVQQTNFYKQNKDHIEIQAQFPIGKYLRMINKADIPAYRTDFLLTFSLSNSKPVSIILEYDGFEYHFKDGYEVNKSNFDDYYVAQDIERQKALETYGYEFIRVNKFILADDPIGNLDQKFSFIVKKKTFQTPSLRN